MIPLFSDMSDDEKRVVDVLHSVEGWPIDFGKDAEFLHRMQDVFPELDLYDEACGFAAWMSEHSQKKSLKHRARFRNWLKKADEFRKEKRGPGSGRYSSHRDPQVEGHGETVQARKDW